MTPAQLEVIQDIRAENAVIFSFMQAVITTHHSPNVLLQAFNRAHDMLIGPLLADPQANDAQLARIEDQRSRLAARIEAHLQARQIGAGASKA
jgi:hypothetical protein